MYIGDSRDTKIVYLKSINLYITPLRATTLVITSHANLSNFAYLKPTKSAI